MNLSNCVLAAFFESLFEDKLTSRYVITKLNSLVTERLVAANLSYAVSHIIKQETKNSLILINHCARVEKRLVNGNDWPPRNANLIRFGISGSV